MLWAACTRAQYETLTNHASLCFRMRDLKCDILKYFPTLGIGVCVLFCSRFKKRCQLAGLTYLTCVSLVDPVTFPAWASLALRHHVTYFSLGARYCPRSIPQAPAPEEGLREISRTRGEIIVEIGSSVWNDGQNQQRSADVSLRAQATTTIHLKKRKLVWLNRKASCVA